MDYKNKYIKYKTKYTDLKREMNHRIAVADINTKTIIRSTLSGKLKNNISALYKICEPGEIFVGLTDYSICMMLKDVDKNLIIGFMILTEMSFLQAMELNTDSFITKGGIPNKKGLFLTSLCGDPNYKGVTEPLMNKLDNYVKNNKYEYVCLHVSNKRPKVEHLYSSFGFTKTGLYRDTENNELFTIMIKFYG